jgi:hypothetical protein
MIDRFPFTLLVDSCGSVSLKACIGFYEGQLHLDLNLVLVTETPKKHDGYRDSCYPPNVA